MGKKIPLPKLGQHIVFLGRTGSGKSQLAEKMINAYGDSVRVFSIDTDDSIELKGSKKVTNLAEVKFWFHFYRKLRYVPDYENQTREAWEALFQYLVSTSTYKKQNPLIVHVNEIYRLGYGSNFPHALPVTMATARKRKISMFIETQRPKAIPVPVLSEASRIYIWMLRREDDRKYIAGYIGGDDKKTFLSLLNNQEKDFSFIGIDGDTGNYEHYKPIKI